ncbi:MAG: site-2 protease family protein [Brachymonas sp.]|nr:site-2 protease family protein [Brachymonas sp.]
MTTAPTLQALAVYALPVLLAITLHEAAHAYAAWRLGDNTAYAQGRVTLNPLRHIDPIGTLAMPLLLYFSTGGSFVFGYARPVPVVARQLRRPRRDMALVALAGPLTNGLQAWLWLALVYAAQAQGLAMQESFFLRMGWAGAMSNLAMFVFNLFPILPLDGGRILAALLPPAWTRRFARLEPFGFYIVLLLLLTGAIDSWWMQPLLEMSLRTMTLLWLLLFS